MQTLADVGYSRRPNEITASSDDVCFVWFSQSNATGKPDKDLAWTRFRRYTATPKMEREGNNLVTVCVPSKHYGKSLEALREEALLHPPTYPIGRNKTWIGPVLLRNPCPPPEIGQVGLNFVLRATEPAQSAGTPMSYGFSPGFTPTLQIGIAA